MIPVVIYAAKSTADERGSIPRQIEEVRTTVEREGERFIYAEPQSDEARSAFTGNRGPGLAAAKALAAQAASEYGEAELWVLHSDRLARGDGFKPGEPAHLVKVWIELRELGITPRSVMDDDSLRNLVLVAVMGERNNQDSRRKREDATRQAARRRKAGLYQGGPRPFGYRFGSNGEGLIPDAFEAPIVRRIFAEFVAGASLRGIANRLNAEKVKGPNGGRWHNARIAERIDNPLYAGKLGSRHSAALTDGAHEPLIDVGTWEKAQALRAAMKASDAGGRGRRPARHLFRRGFLRCAKCGSAMRPMTTHDTYRCTGRDDRTTDCDMPPVPRAAADAAVVEYFRAHAFNPEAAREEFKAEHARAVAEAHDRAAAARMAAEKARAAAARWDAAFEEGEITIAEWRPRIEGQRQAAEAADAEAEQWERRTGQLTSERAADHVHDDWQRCRDAALGEIADADTRDALRAALARVFDHFRVAPVENHAPVIELEGEAMMFDAPRARFVLIAEPRVEALTAFESGGEPSPFVERIGLPRVERKERIGLPCR
jgi:site-specific DNA recombinase